MFTLAAVLMFVFQGPPSAPATSGSLVGCASDTMQQRLPGVTVVATSGRLQRTATADAGGCYELRDLRTGSYRVTARLAGFDNVTRDGVNIVAGKVARLEVAMRVSAICECVRLGGMTLAEQWDRADAVLHVRLAASESQPTAPVGYYRHVATVNGCSEEACSLARDDVCICASKPAACCTRPVRRRPGVGCVSAVLRLERVRDHERRARAGRSRGKLRSRHRISHFRTPAFNVPRPDFPATSVCHSTRSLASCALFRTAGRRHGYTRAPAVKRIIAEGGCCAAPCYFRFFRPSFPKPNGITLSARTGIGVAVAIITTGTPG